MFDSLVIDSFRANGLTPPRATIYVEDHHMKIKLAATGRFLAVVPASVLRFSTTRGSIKMLPVELPTTHRPSGIITLKNRTLSSPAQLFIKCVREVAKPLAKIYHRCQNRSSRWPKSLWMFRNSVHWGGWEARRRLVSMRLTKSPASELSTHRFPSVADILKKPVCRNLRS